MHTILRRLALLFSYRYNRERVRIVNRSLDFVRHAKVQGDYFEFGVFQGAVFSYAFQAATLRGEQSMHFVALDSFKGFSAPKGNDDIGTLAEGDRSCSEEQFLANLQRARVDMTRVTTVPGFFADTLQGQGRSKTDKLLGERKVAIAYIDCDLYEPAYDALHFLTDRIVDGTVVIFDNWFLFKGSPFRGEPKAFKQWLSEHPEFIATHFYNFGWHGASYILNTVPGKVS